MLKNFFIACLLKAGHTLPTGCYCALTLLRKWVMCTVVLLKLQPLTHTSYYPSTNSLYDMASSVSRQCCCTCMCNSQQISICSLLHVHLQCTVNQHIQLVTQDFDILELSNHFTKSTTLSTRWQWSITVEIQDKERAWLLPTPYFRAFR